MSLNKIIIIICAVLSRDAMDLLVPEVNLVYRGPTDNQAREERQVHRVNLDLQDNREHKDPAENKASLDHRDLEEKMDNQEALVQFHYHIDRLTYSTISSSKTQIKKAPSPNKLCLINYVK